MCMVWVWEYAQKYPDTETNKLSQGMAIPLCRSSTLSIIFDTLLYLNAYVDDCINLGNT